MVEAKRLKKLLSKEKKELPGTAQEAMESSIDTVALEKMMKRMKGKYEAAGIERGEMVGKAAEVKQMIDLGPAGLKIKTGAAKELALHDNKWVSGFGKFYNVLHAPLDLIVKVGKALVGKKLLRDLGASNMPYSVEQYLSLVAAASFMAFIIALFVVLSFVFVFKLSWLMAILMLLIIPIFCLAFAVLIPSSKAGKIGAEIDRQLPFALRHMSIEIRAGVGIFKTMESVASANYGPVSDGFRYVLFSIEKGVPTEEALENWAERTRSDGLKRAITHLVRALRTGGNLSQIMVSIADDVSFERKLRIADFADKLSLLSLFLLMVMVVFPVLVTILTAIGNSPSIKSFMPMFSMFSPLFLAIIYFVFCPVLMLVFMILIRGMDPG